MKLVAASKMRGDINRYEAAAPFGEIFTRLSTVPEDFDEPEETKSSKTTMVRLFFWPFAPNVKARRIYTQFVRRANCRVLDLIFHWLFLHSV